MRVLNTSGLPLAALFYAGLFTALLFDTTCQAQRTSLGKVINLQEYHCYSHVDAHGRRHYDFDVDRDGRYTAEDLRAISAVYGGQVTPLDLEHLVSLIGDIAERPIDSPALKFFDVHEVRPSGMIATVSPGLESGVFLNRRPVFPYEDEDLILLYTASDEPHGMLDCPMAGWQACMKTFRVYLFTELNGQPVAEEFYYLRYER